MNSQSIIYIDQNIIQYIYENKLELNVDNEIIWAYSNEHFGEINRHNDDSQCFEVLEHLKARKVEIQLDNKYKITDTCVLYDYESPRILYSDYLDTINDYKHISTQFMPLLTFLYGNTEFLNIDNYIEQFKSNLNSLTTDILEDNDSFSKLYENLIGSIAEQLKTRLKEAQNQIQPLDKTRKTITKKQLSDLKHEDGEIIEQIWTHVKHYFENFSITKDQLFGKEKLPFLNNKTDKNNQTFFEGIIQCHALLNHLGYWPDEKLTRPSKIFGINSDASHIAHGFFCSGILSADERLCQKAKAIYEYYGKTDNVFQLVFDKS